MNFTVSYPTTDVTHGEALTSAVTGNLSITPIYDDYDERLEYTLHIIYIISYSLAFLLGTVGNGLVIYFTAFRMKRTVNIVWFLNLAIADFILMFFLIFRIVTTALDDHWIFGGFMCRMNIAIFYINLHVSIFLITAISIDRCISVANPVWSQNHRTPRLASIMAPVIWIVAIVFSLPYFIFSGTDYYGKKISCALYSNSRDFQQLIDNSLVISRFILCFAIPLIVILSCYAIILLRIQRNRMITSSKPFKIVVAVIIAFFICWFPFHLFYFVYLTIHFGGKKAVLIAISLSEKLAIINSCINPILYVFVGGNLKEKFWRSFQSIFESAFMEEPVQVNSKSESESTAESQLL